MSVGRRIGNIIIGFLIIAGGVILILLPEIGYLVIALILAISLLVSGISSLVYYFTMARHMVGGRNTLYSGLIMLDFAMLTLSFSDVPKVFIMLYLGAVYGVTGLLHVLRGLEARKRKAPNWYWSFISGLLNLIIALFCTIFIKNTVVMVIIYSIGLIFSGFGRIVSAFSPAKIVHIQ